MVEVQVGSGKFGSTSESVPRYLYLSSSCQGDPTSGGNAEKILKHDDLMRYDTG